MSERAAPVRQALRLVLLQEGPSLWQARGLEHDVVAHGNTVSGALRAVVRFIEAHTAFDLRHDLAPLSAFQRAPQTYWNAHAAGMPLSFEQLDVHPPDEWDICVTLALRRSSD